jgi:thiol-disulfide isomerase/thioredoxin
VSTGLIVLLVVVPLVLAFGLYRAWNDGRFRGTHEVEGAAVSGPRSEVLEAIPDLAIGERATLLQFSSAFCAPCRATRRVLSEVAEVVPGVTHVEIDAEHHLEAVRALGVLRTPTTLILDASGHEATRAAGAPRKEQVLGALASLG